MNSTKSHAASTVDDETWQRDPDQFPSFRTISPGMMFFRRVLVYRGPSVPLEFVTVKMPAARTASADAFVQMTQWNMQWEAGPYRACDTARLSALLAFLKRLEAQESDRPSSDIVLLPEFENDIYEKWAALYHLLPRPILAKFHLPVLGRGIWPIRGTQFSDATLAPRHSAALASAFAHHLWNHGLAGTRSPIAAFDRREPLVLLSHDLAFWRTAMERLLRERCASLGRIKKPDDDKDPPTTMKSEDLTYELPTFGTDVWTGEDEASEATFDLIETADAQGLVRGLLEAVRSTRVEEDFSPRWSFAREDFERRLYKKRSKVKVSFVELKDSTPFLDSTSEIDGNLVYRDLLSIVNPKERHVVVCIHSGATTVTEIADALGYANHSPVSKALARIRVRAARLLND